MSQSNKKIQEINNDVNETKGILKNNIRQVVDNTEKINELKDRAANINSNALEMRLLAKNTKDNSQFCTPKMKLVIILLSIFVFLIILYFIIAEIRCHSINIFCNKEEANNN